MCAADDHKRRLVLWDVDRTLLHVEGVTRLVYEDAFLAVVGRPMEHLADMAGRTDRYIIANTLALHGITRADDLLGPFYEELGKAVRARRAMLRRNGRALPGAREALAAVARIRDVVQSVVTGNTREIATEKLSAFGMDEHLDYDVGGYGDEASDRRELVRQAHDRTERKYATSADGRARGWLGLGESWRRRLALTSGAQLELAHPGQVHARPQQPPRVRWEVGDHRQRPALAGQRRVAALLPVRPYGPEARVRWRGAVHPVEASGPVISDTSPQPRHPCRQRRPVTDSPIYAVFGRPPSKGDKRR